MFLQNLGAAKPKFLSRNLIQSDPSNGASIGATLILWLVLAGAIGWYDIFARNVYATPHWLEPWDRVARQEANLSSQESMVIGKNPSSFFYLTYLLPQTSRANISCFIGLLPESIRVPNIYTPQQWSDGGAPTGPTTSFRAEYSLYNGWRAALSP
jgi:hypothetical protein